MGQMSKLRCRCDIFLKDQEFSRDGEIYDMCIRWWATSCFQMSDIELHFWGHDVKLHVVIYHCLNTNDTQN